MPTHEPPEPGAHGGSLGLSSDPNPGRVQLRLSKYFIAACPRARAAALSLVASVGAIVLQGTEWPCGALSPLTVGERGQVLRSRGRRLSPATPTILPFLGKGALFRSPRSGSMAEPLTVGLEF